MSRLEAVGVLHEDAAVLAALTFKWVESSGEEWTVRRFKALKLEFITGTLAQDCVVRRAPWVARDDQKVIKGPLRRFWVDPHYVANPQVVLNAFQIYSSFIASSATEAQTAKFLESARSAPTVLPKKLSKFISSFDWDGVEKLIALHTDPYWKYYRSPVKRVPALQGTAPEDQISSDLSFAAQSEAVRRMFRFQFKVMSLTLPEDMLHLWRTEDEPHPFVGVVSYIQEAGYKLRAVANPTRVVQHALAPLKEALGHVLKTFPEDCTFNQDSGVNWCQNQLQSGKTLHSIDLSDATNLFPFEVQELVLKGISTRLKKPEREYFLQLCSLFTVAAKAPWRLPDGTPLVFTKGQPLGLGPSFFLFALSHHVILHSLAGAGKYVILGDDVVISDSKLANDYRNLMSELGCRISEEKSIESQQIAEFASRLIRPNDVLRQWKWREITRSNVIDICRNMGSKFRTQVKRPLSDVIDALAPIPIELGGLGWNPKGLPLSSRLDNSVAQHILYSAKEQWIVCRRWRSSAVSDFLTARIRLQSTNSGNEHLHPFLDKNITTAYQITLSMMEDDDWAKEVVRYQVEELKKLDRPGPDLGETILWPLGLRKPNGYITWGPPNNPWQTDSTGLYRVVARILKGERRANLELD